MKQAKLLLTILFFLLFNSLYSAELSSSEKILSVKMGELISGITANIYSFVLTRQENNDEIFVHIYDDQGNEKENESLGVQSGITKGYLLLIDKNKAYQVDHVLAFLLDSDDKLVKVISLNVIVSINDIILDSQKIENVNSTQSLINDVKVIPHYEGDTVGYFVLPLQNETGSEIEVYKYKPTLNDFLTLHGSISFNSEELKTILPFNGFIIAVTNIPKAYFISLNSVQLYYSKALTSYQNVYVYYDPATQKTFLKTATDSTGVEIQDAPMPYGVIGMQSTQ